MFLRARLPEHESLQLEGLPLNCEVQRSKRKSLALHVRHDRIECAPPAYHHR